MTKKFMKRDWKRHSKLGKGRKKKQKYKRPKGRDNKIRENKKGYPKKVKIGFKNSESKVEEVVVHNLRELIKVGENEEFFIGDVGAKKRYEIVMKCKEMGLERQIQNLNVKKFLKMIEHKKSKKKRGETVKVAGKKDKKEDKKTKLNEESKKSEEIKK
jgi:large subunit ribosomal protein L32e